MQIVTLDPAISKRTLNYLFAASRNFEVFIPAQILKRWLNTLYGSDYGKKFPDVLVEFYAKNELEIIQTWIKSLHRFPDVFFVTDQVSNLLARSVGGFHLENHKDPLQFLLKVDRLLNNPAWFDLDSILTEKTEIKPYIYELGNSPIGLTDGILQVFAEMHR